MTHKEHMSAEERAEALIDELHADWFSDPREDIKAAIMAAEGDIVERAAIATSYYLMMHTDLKVECVANLEDIIRSLKHKATP